MFKRYWGNTFLNQSAILYIWSFNIIIHRIEQLLYWY